MKLNLFFLTFFIFSTQIGSCYCMFDFLFDDIKKLQERKNRVEEEFNNYKNKQKIDEDTDPDENISDSNGDETDSYDYIDKESLEYQVYAQKNKPGCFSFEKANVNEIMELSYIRKKFENSDYKKPEERLELLSKCLFDKIIRRYDDNINEYSYNLSKKDSLELSQIIIKSFYNYKEGSLDFDIDYIKLLDIIFENIISVKFNYPIVLQIINNMPSLQEILQIRLEKISPEEIHRYESKFKIYDLILPNEFRNAFAKLFTQIACLELNNKFKFEDRENLLKSLARKILNSNYDNRHWARLPSIIKDRILEIPNPNTDQITLNGIDLKQIKSLKKKSKIISKISNQLNHSLRIVDEIVFEVEETRSDYSESGSESNSENETDPDMPELIDVTQNLGISIEPKELKREIENNPDRTSHFSELNIDSKNEVDFQNVQEFENIMGNNSSHHK